MICENKAVKEKLEELENKWMKKMYEQIDKKQYKFYQSHKFEIFDDLWELLELSLKESLNEK